jgi:hypothetical protein
VLVRVRGPVALKLRGVALDRGASAIELRTLVFAATGPPLLGVVVAERSRVVAPRGSKVRPNAPPKGFGVVGQRQGSSFRLRSFLVAVLSTFSGLAEDRNHVALGHVRLAVHSREALL